jgi:hypothetical protein
MRFWDYATFAAAISSIVWFGWICTRGEDQRHEEDAARDFFDRHGVWPDEVADDDPRRT